MDYLIEIKKIKTKITILTKIKEIKQQNLVKINELILRINKKNIINNVNAEINFSVTNKSKSNLSQI
ncbi:hypothetical protein [Spiroplasma endosymbiont of Danaus chrysippus]|uniref:hypothetical protein n=1 Tax=Spiroplasma endosymbiont of Danaus chrysippus TaxID=2691041 RepID=UPI00157A7812|nr:hypothetical protein [Spiroplasma endosymbiont of Danaus chrysippus]